MVACSECLDLEEDCDRCLNGLFALDCDVLRGPNTRSVSRLLSLDIGVERADDPRDCGDLDL